MSPPKHNNKYITRASMETKIAVVETEVKNVHARLIDYWNDVKASTALHGTQQQVLCLF